MYVDEVGDKTSQRNDGSRSGTKYVTGKWMLPQQQNNFTDTHFTTLGFTAATGEPIVCIVIIKGTPCPLEKVGYNCLSPDWGGEDCKYDYEELEELVVEEIMHVLYKLFPCGPTCKCNRNTVPCLVEGRPNGSITSELLAKALKHMDRLELFDRSDDIYPLLLLDGHGCRLKLPYVIMMMLLLIIWAPWPSMNLKM
jgi:hypothetical protein